MTTTAARYEGQNYTGYRDAAQIAKDIRADIKDAKKTGRIPADVKVSVKTRKYAGGQAIDCTLSGWGAEVIYTGTGYERDLTPIARQIITIVEGIRESYNRDNSDPYTDYYDVTYYGSTDWDWRIK